LLATYYSNIPIPSRNSKLSTRDIAALLKVGEVMGKGTIVHSGIFKKLKLWLPGI
jgi:hypothetical protein